MISAKNEIKRFFMFLTISNDFQNHDIGKKCKKEWFLCLLSILYQLYPTKYIGQKGVILKFF